MFDGVLAQFGLEPDDAEALIREEASKNLSDIDFIALELADWKDCKRRKEMLDGLGYYRYTVGPDIKQKLWGRDADGCPTYVTDESPRTLDNQYANLVDQKVNYMVGKPLTMQANNDSYSAYLQQVFDKAFLRTIQRVTTGALNEGLAWLMPYFNENGELQFKMFPAHEIMPFWKNDEHTELDMAVRFYLTVQYVGRTKTYIQHADVYYPDKVGRFILNNGTLTPNTEELDTTYGVDKQGNAFTWGKVPLVAFKYNTDEIPLIRRIKGLQDNLNKMRNNWNHSMSESVMDNILVLRNYGGENLSEFKRQLMQYGAVKVRDDGGVEVLRLDRDVASYTEYLKNTKKALIENGRGFDAKDDRVGNNPNEMNLRSMYSDIDLDTDMIEQQYQAAFDQLFYFVDIYLQMAGAGDFTNEEVTVTFNRNMIVNDAEIISEIQQSQGLVSQETLLAHHPFVTDIQAEQERLKHEQQEQMQQMLTYQMVGENSNADTES